MVSPSSDRARSARADVELVRAARFRRVLALLIALCCNALFSSSSCVVIYCSEDCDPCLVATCKCSTCKHSNASFEATHRLDAYRLSLVVDRGGRITRIYGEIVGLSLDRALGSEPHTEADLTRFARDVLAVNSELLNPAASDKSWVLDSVDEFNRARVASFRSVGRDGNANASRMTLLFDSAGNLLEIDHALGD